MIALEWDPASWTVTRRLADHRGAVCAAVGLPAAAAPAAPPPAAAAPAASRSKAAAAAAAKEARAAFAAAAASEEWLATASIDGFLKVWAV